MHFDPPPDTISTVTNYDRTISELNVVFVMVDMVSGDGSKCTKIPSKSAYLRELGLSFTKHQKLLKSVQ